MNPSVPTWEIEDAYERDPASAAAEYGAEFRTDIEVFISRAAVDAAVVPGRIELPYVRDLRYRAFADPSGGAQDSMTLAIAHREKGEGDRPDTVVLDVVREVRPPFSPDEVVTDFVAILKSYNLQEVVGDRWGGEFVRETFGKRGIRYEVSERPKSDLYRELLPLCNLVGVPMALSCGRTRPTRPSPNL